MKRHFHNISVVNQLKKKMKIKIFIRLVYFKVFVGRYTDLNLKKCILFSIISSLFTCLHIPKQMYHTQPYLSIWKRTLGIVEVLSAQTKRVEKSRLPRRHNMTIWVCVYTCPCRKSQGESIHKSRWHFVRIFVLRKLGRKQSIKPLFFLLFKVPHCF